jgi:hypothetical protein
VKPCTSGIIEQTLNLAPADAETALDDIKDRQWNLLNNAWP